MFSCSTFCAWTTKNWAVVKTESKITWDTLHVQESLDITDIVCGVSPQQNRETEVVPGTPRPANGPSRPLELLLLLTTPERTFGV